MAAEVAENLEWSYQIAHEIIGIGYRRAESRYNERLGEKKYKPGSLVRVGQHTHLYGVPSKLNPKFSGLCKVLELRGPTLTLRELDTNKVFTASHDAVRTSTLSHPEVPLQAKPPAELPNTLNAESRSAASRICVSLPMTSGCPLPHRKFHPLLTSISPRPPLSVLQCRRRNSLLVLNVMFVSFKVLRPLSRIPSPCRHSRVSLLCRCHSRSHPLLTLPSLVFLEPIYHYILHQSERKIEFSFRLQVAQS